MNMTRLLKQLLLPLILIFSVLPQNSQANSTDVYPTINQITTTTLQFSSLSNCTLIIGNTSYGEENITQLTPGVTYQVNFTCCNCSELFTTRPDRIEQPLVSQTTSSISLNWTRPAGEILHYILEWHDDGGTTTTTITNESSAVLSDLVAGTNYTVNVTTVAQDNQTTGDPRIFSAITRPVKPGAIELTERGTHNLSIAWTLPSGKADHYVVTISNQDLNFNSSNTTADTAASFTSLSPGRIYEITVTAVAGSFTNSSNSSFATVPTAPDLIVINQSNSSLYLEWTTPPSMENAPEISYNITYQPDGGVAESQTSTANNSTLHSLISGVKYMISIETLGPRGLSSVATQNFSFTLPNPVMNLIARPESTTSVTVQWSDPVGARPSYTYRVQTTNMSGTTVDLDTTVGTNSTVVTGLQPGSGYHFTVTVVAAPHSVSDAEQAVGYTRPDRIEQPLVSQTTSSISLNWTRPAGEILHYILEWHDDGGTTTTTITNESSAVLSDLVAGTNYTVNVTTVAQDNQTTGDPRIFSAITRPVKPGAVELTERGTHNFSITWTLPSGKADHYVVTISNQDLNFNSSNTTVDTAASFTSLSPGRIYEITVTAVAGSFTNSSNSSFATVPTAPELIVINQSNSSLYLEWTTPPSMENAPEISYNITYQPDGGVAESQTSTANNSTLLLLNSGVKYMISIETLGPRGLSSVATQNFSFTLPNPVINLIARPESTTSVTVQWSDPVGARPHYTYSVQTTNMSGTTVDLDTTVGTNSTVVTGLQPGSGYHFTVTVVAAPHSVSDAEQAVGYTIPEAVTNLTVTDVNTTAFQLTWLGQRSDSYQVIVLRDTAVVMSAFTTDQTYTVTNLVPGENYVFQLINVANGVNSTATTTTSHTVPGSVSGLVAIGTTTNMSVEWEAAGGRVDGYTVLLFRDGQVEGNHSGLSNSTLSTRFEELKPGTLYTVRVVTKSGPGFNTANATNATYPNPPGPLIVRSQTTDSINISWSLPVDMEIGRYNFTVFFLNYSIPTGNNWVLLNDLQSGTLYDISVVTVGALGYQSTAVTTQTSTKPRTISNLTATTLNTTTISLGWQKPQQYQQTYTYRVEVSNCTSQNTTVVDESAVISELTPGTQCTLCVWTSTSAGLEGGSVCTDQYTEPNGVQPSVSNEGSNSTILVSWSAPPGNVEGYVVHLNRTDKAFDPEKLGPNRTSFQFHGLSAGREYAAMVETVSGSFSACSGYVSNATFPNSPGPIEIMTRTTSSISVQWEEAPLMAGAEFQYNVTYTLSEGTEPTVTTSTSTSYTFTDLLSGTSYNISVATVGPLNLQSEEVRSHLVTTRPESVESLDGSTDEERVTLRWARPEGYKPSYSYQVTWGDGSDTTEQEDYTASPLVPGSPYNFSVTTVTQDGTQAAAVHLFRCTKASQVLNLTCHSPNGADARIILSWSEPRGQRSGFRLDLDDAAGRVVTHLNDTCNPRCQRNVTDLQYHKTYLLTLRTLSCGNASDPVSLECTTGITNPIIPTNYDSLVSVDQTEHDKFTINIDPDLLTSTTGPISQFGVLVSDDKESGVNSSDLARYVANTYEEWNAGTTSTYLATVRENPSQRRSEANPLLVEIGSGEMWNNYTNGPLRANQQYRYAIVLFTQLKLLENGIVDLSSSFVSTTAFYSVVVILPTNPGEDTSLTMAVGTSVGAFCVVLIIIIGFIVYRKRVNKKEHSDIQIQSMRPKANMAVNVEEFEVFYRKQKADSNCGFAEEFEDLKPVGTAQTKTSALALENKSKNRYNNVLPYDSSRVKLSIHGSPFDDYINANYMPGYNSRKEFIAAQGPLPGTVNEFWRMVWEKNIKTLVMLTSCTEQGRVKCEKYWPAENKHFGNITVTTTSEIILEDWTLRDFDIKNVKTAETRSVRQFHFTAWPDHGVPESTELLINFRHLVREHMDQYSAHSPTIVHCSAGVGRTGTLIAIDRLIFQIERDSLVDVYGIVHDLRMHRPLMVQTEDQYVFLNQCAIDVIRSRTGTNVDLIYQNTAALSIYENIEPKKNGYRV